MSTDEKEQHREYEKQVAVMKKRGRFNECCEGRTPRRNESNEMGESFPVKLNLY